jgi:hypothetical protein
VAIQPAMRGHLCGDLRCATEESQKHAPLPPNHSTLAHLEEVRNWNAEAYPGPLFRLDQALGGGSRSTTPPPRYTFLGVQSGPLCARNLAIQSTPPSAQRPLVADQRFRVLVVATHPVQYMAISCTHSRANPSDALLVFAGEGPLRPQLNSRPREADSQITPKAKSPCFASRAIR